MHWPILQRQQISKSYGNDIPICQTHHDRSTSRFLGTLSPQEVHISFEQHDSKLTSKGVTDVTGCRDNLHTEKSPDERGNGSMEPLATDSFVLVLFGREILLSYNSAERHNLMPHKPASVPFIKHLLILNLKFDATDPWYDEIEPNPPHESNDQNNQSTRTNNEPLDSRNDQTPSL